MSKRTGLLLGGTKMVERHLRRALPTDTEMIEVRSIEAAMKRLDEEEVTILVFGPTLRRSLALVTTLRSDAKTANLPLVVVFRDDQRSEVSRHLDGKYKADAYVIQSRAQRDLELAIAAALKGGGAAGDLHVASEQLDVLPLGAVSALTQDVSSLAHAARLPPIDSALELDVIDMEEVSDEDASETAPMMMDVLEFEDDLEEIEAPDGGDAVQELSAADFIATTGDNAIVSAPSRDSGDFLPEALPLEELDGDLLKAGEDEAQSDQGSTGAAATAQDDGNAEELWIDDDVEDLGPAEEEVAAEADVEADGEDEMLADDASILEELDDIEELAEIEPFEVSTVTDLAANIGGADAGDVGTTLAADLEAELQDSDDLDAEPIDAEDIDAEDVAAEDVDAEDVDAEDVAAEDVDAEDVDAEDVDAEDVDAEDVDAEDVDAEDVDAEDVDAEDIAAEEVAAEDVAAEVVALATAPKAAKPEAQAPAADEPQPNTEPPQQVSSSGPRSLNLSELTSLIAKLQAALAEIERLETENAGLRQSLTGEASNHAKGEQLAAALARAEAAAAAALTRAVAAEEAAQAASAARAASDVEFAAAQLSLADTKTALTVAEATRQAAEARIADLLGAAAAREAALAGARDLLMQAAGRLGA